MVDRLESMAVFVKAAELGSFTKAGAALGLSAQMIGKHVGQLEARLGVELLRRTTRRQSLTVAGEVYLERCRTILADLEDADALIHELDATPRGRLRVSAPVAFGAICVAPVVRAFAATRPAVEVELVLDDRFVDLVEERFDAVVRLGPLKDSGFLSRRLAPHRLVACAAPAYLAQRGHPRRAADLAAHECLAFLYSTGLPLSEWCFERDGETETVEVAGRLRCNDSRVLLDAAFAGDGIVLTAERVVREALADGRLVRVLPEWTGPSRELHLVMSGSRRQTAKLRAFIDAVVAALGGD